VLPHHGSSGLDSRPKTEREGRRDGVVVWRDTTSVSGVPHPSSPVWCASLPATHPWTNQGEPLGTGATPAGITGWVLDLGWSAPECGTP
jgi:hypothetical protein